MKTGRFRYLHCHNFQYLTGLGAEFADVADAAMGFLDQELGGAISELRDAVASHGVRQISFRPGCLRVQYDEEINQFGWYFDGYEEGGFVERFGEHRAKYGATHLGDFAFILKRGDRRRMTALCLPWIMKGARNLDGGHQVYGHYFADDRGLDIEGAQYIGVTKRGWRTRFKEHLAAASRGSRYRFHEALRRWNDSAPSISHIIIKCGLSEAEAMAAEEEWVGKETLYPRGLNMIPGGYAGIAYLHKIGAVGPRERVTPDDKHEIINRFFATTARKGLPNPLAAANWCDPDYAEKVICGGDDRLKPDQIRAARFLSSLGKATDDIAAEIGARNIPQVQRLLAGETYSRVL